MYLYLFLQKIRSIKVYVILYFLAFAILIFLNKFFNFDFFILFQIISMMFFFQNLFDYLYIDKTERFELYLNISPKIIYLEKYLFIFIFYLCLTLINTCFFLIFNINIPSGYYKIFFYTLNIINLSFLIGDIFKPIYSNYFFYIPIIIKLLGKYNSHFSISFIDFFYNKSLFFFPAIFLFCLLYNYWRKVNVI